MNSSGDRCRSLAARGWDLARRGHPYEAHEAWEECWLELHGDEKLWLQALIQLVVAELHGESGNPAGAASLREKATVKLSRLAALDFQEPAWCEGLRLPLPCPLLERLARRDDTPADGSLWRRES